MIVNCSNIKPHVFQLQAIAKLWESGDLVVEDYKYDYVTSYYNLSKESEIAQEIVNLYTDYSKSTIAFGEHEDEHAGEQFTNYMTRDFITRWIKGDIHTSVKEVQWATGQLEFKNQIDWYKGKCEDGYRAFSQLYERCMAVSAAMQGDEKQLFHDSLFLQIQIGCSCMKGVIAFCRAYEAYAKQQFMQSFYFTGVAKESYEEAVHGMELAEHDKWAGFYQNDCLTDIKFTSYLLGTLMQYIRVIGDGPHFYKWQRELLYKEEDRRVVLLTNIENHLKDDELYEIFKRKHASKIEEMMK